MKVHTINFLKSSVVATVGALLAASPSFAASIGNGDFETSFNGTPELSNGGFIQLATAQQGPTGWFAEGGGGALYLGNTFTNNNGAVSRTVLLNGATPGGLSTTVSNLAFNEQVDVSFDLTANPNGAGGQTPTPVVAVSLSNATTAVGNLATAIITGTVPTLSPTANAVYNLNFQRFVASFIYTGQSGQATLTFLSNSGSNTGFGPIIDNVSVTPIPFEFSPVTGFIAGGILFGGYKLVNRKKLVG